MAEQTIIFTVMPRGMSLNPATLPVSVYVSPRLSGEKLLTNYPDWLDWTGLLQSEGLALIFRSGTRTIARPIDRAPLRPDLWRAMFKQDTFVRSYAYTDYSDRAVFSYPTRVALSTIKTVYQQAGVGLALPDRGPVHDQERGDMRRRFLQELLGGLEVNWTDEGGERLRKAYRSAFGKVDAFTGVQARYQAGQIAADGTLATMPAPGTPAAKAQNKMLATQFGLYTHMAQGAPIADNPPDFDELIDFHQALSALNSYPDLLRALGLVFDLDLPTDFLDATPLNAPGKLAVAGVRRRGWAIPTKVAPDLPPQETAYLYFSLGDAANPTRLFTTAPAVLGGALPELEIFGLLTLFPTRYGIAQVDVESGMHKTTRLAESWQPGRRGPSSPDRPDVYDETTTLPALRSGGLSVFADGRAMRLLNTFKESRKFNESLEQNAQQKRPFYAEDLVHGFRIDIWDSHTNHWHSLHRRNGVYVIEDETFKTHDEEGFTQLAAAQSAPDANNPPPKDLYLNESVARWSGWSLSVPFPGKAMSRDPDPAKALEDDPQHPANEPATPFKMTTAFTIVPKSLPSLRFGRRYRLRVRPVDICGNSLKHDAPLAHLLSLIAGLPLDPEGFAYLRYEPVVAPTLVLRDIDGVQGPGSQLERLVIRTFNADESLDAAPADLTASDRFVAPPGTSVEVAERLGMFDDAAGKIVTSAAMHALIGERDKGKFNEVTAVVAGKQQNFPLEAAESIDVLPYLPDVLARGAAFRDLPGVPEGTIASVAPGAGADQPIAPEALGDANPRPGSATLVGFGGEGDWQQLQPFRLALADGSGAPSWDPANRILTVFLPKGTMHVVPLSSHLRPDDLKWMGVWQWLREFIDQYVVQKPSVAVLDADLDSEKIAHILQRAVEGGHWMITPPKLLTLVHAVQQPIGRPAFTGITVQREPYGTVDKWKQVDEKLNPDPKVLQTEPEEAPTPASELSPITAWRKPGSEDAFLLGGLKMHVESTGKVDILAEWSDPFDDAAQPRVETDSYVETQSARVEEILLPTTAEGYVDTARGTSNQRNLGYFDADQGVLCFVRQGDRLGSLQSGTVIYSNAAPRHHLNDTKYHRVRYTAKSTSRYQEYFAKDQALDFTRTSESVDVDVPAAARPSAPQIDYVVPTFGWQRQTQTNVKRSVRFGGGLRVYLHRPWFSSGAGELVGVALYDWRNGSITDREAWKPFITQWGIDPIWTAPGLVQLPDHGHFPNAAATEFNLSVPGRVPGRVGVAGFPVDFDYGMQRWFADVTIDVQAHAYCPFIRLALVRYQPHALPDAKLSAVALADYAQLTPERSAVVTADPYHPRRLRLTVSGPGPTGPAPVITGRPPTTPINVPAMIVVSVEERDDAIQSDLGWREAPAAVAAVAPQAVSNPTGLLRWSGSVTFAATPPAGRYRLVIREYEYLSANYTELASAGRPPQREQPKRLVYAEILEIDAALIGGPSAPTGTVIDG